MRSLILPTSFLILSLLCLFFPFTTAVALLPAPNTTSPDTLPIDPMYPELVATDLSSFPSQIIITDGDFEYFPVIVNCVGNLIHLGTPKEEIYVLAYDAKVAVVLGKCGFNVIWRPDWLEEGEQLARRFHCKIKGGKKKMDLVMYMKRRLFLELAYRGVKFMIFDSDVILHTNPKQFMGANRPTSMYGKGIDAVIFGADHISVGSIVGWSNSLSRDGRFALNGSPGAFLNVKLFIPWFKAFFEYGISLWQNCVWGWGQVGDNAILYQAGLRWEMTQDKDGIEDNQAQISVWGAPVNQTKRMINQRLVRPRIGSGLMEELFGEGKRKPMIFAADTQTKFMPARHYNVPGGPPKKEAIMRARNVWFVRDDWKEVLREGGNNVMDFLDFERKVEEREGRNE